MIDELTLGKPVQLIAEVDNPHDPDAVVIYYQDYKLGYVPSSKNCFYINYYTLGMQRFSKHVSSMSIKKVTQSDNLGSREIEMNAPINLYFFRLSRRKQDFC